MGYIFKILLEKEQNMQKKLLEEQLVGRIIIPDSEKEVLLALDKALEEADSSELYFSISLSTEFPIPTIKNGEKVNVLKIRSKDNGDKPECRDMQKLAELLAQALNVPAFEYKKNIFVDHLREFIIAQDGKTELTYCFPDDELEKIIKIIGLARAQCQRLPVITYVEPTETDLLELEHEKEMLRSLAEEDDEYSNY